ncbi:hypothetical protein GNF80_16005 [Clostridium perfringens]|nr:hypothetical protein [Clostridium perfringens]
MIVCKQCGRNFNQSRFVLIKQETSIYSECFENLNMRLVIKFDGQDYDPEEITFK